MKRSGFTLIELSIVLIIIGLIIGGIMKGKDLINSADQKKIYNTWLNQWKVTANEYQDRTGKVLADGTDNGGSEDTENGSMDNVNLGTTTTVQDRLDAVGLIVPSGLNNGGSYTLKGKYYSRTDDIRLLNGGATTENSNAIYVSYMPTDMAIAFDTIADGGDGPLKGDFQNYSDRTTTTWPKANETNYVNIYLKVD